MSKIKAKNSKGIMRRSIVNNLNLNQLKNNVTILTQPQSTKKSNEDDDNFSNMDAYTYDSKRYKSVRS